MKDVGHAACKTERGKIYKICTSVRGQASGAERVQTSKLAAFSGQNVQLRTELASFRMQ